MHLTQKEGLKIKIARMMDKPISVVKRKRNRIIANHYLKMIAKKTNSEIVKIGFIVQMPALWDKQEPLYEELKKRDDCKTYIIVVPENEWRSQEIPNYSNNYFLEKYSDAIKLHDDNGNIVPIETYHLDYLFYPRPYDAYLPNPIRSYELYKNVKCCYIPYGLAAADIFNSGNIYNEFFDYMYFLFMDSEHMKSLMAKEFRNEIRRKFKRVEYFGYPSLERYIDMGPTERCKTVTWTPRWSYDEEQGGSNFLEYKENYIDLVRKHSGKCIFRPHPLMFEELIEKKKISKEESDNYILNIERYSEIDIDSPIDSVLAKTDILISDFSTIVGSFFLTGRPIIYCDKGIQLNEIYEEMSKYMYVAKSWTEVENYYDELVNKNNDVLREKRLEFIRSRFSYEIGSAKRIAEAIVNDARGEKRW